MTGYMVIPGALDVVASGIQSVLDEMTSLGINGEQESGGPIEDATLSTDDLGSEAMAAILADALQRAHYALRTALANGQNVVSLLRTTEASYQDTEQQIGGLFEQIVHDLGAAGRATKTPATTRASHQSTRVLDRLAGGG